MSVRVLLLNPPFLDKYSKSSRSPAVTKSATVYYPLWLSYAAGVLDKRGFEIKIIDAPARCLKRRDDANDQRVRSEADRHRYLNWFY